MRVRVGCVSDIYLLWQLTCSSSCLFFSPSLITLCGTVRRFRNTGLSEGKMDRRYAVLCFLLVLALSAQFGLGLSPGTIHVYNGADGTLTRQMHAVLVDGSQTSDPTPVPFPQGTQFLHNVLPEEEFVYTLYHLTTPSGAQLSAEPIEWSEFRGYVSCMPNCYIVIDNGGFSVAPSAHAPLQHYWGWNY